jgi:hypothetical protein
MGVAGMAAFGTMGATGAAKTAFVRVSPRDPRYFELTDGTPYLPIGLNMIAPPGPDRFDRMREWMEKLAANRGNFIRVWLGNPFFDVEPAKSGEYDAQKAERIDRLLEVARANGIRVKMCIESFRHFGTRNQDWSAKPLHLIERGGPAKDIADFFNGTASREQFKRKLAWYQKRCGDEPTIFGWELWNEINAVAGGDYMAWTEAMLPELHRLFPKNLAMQSLGSFDRAGARPNYQRLAAMPGNDVAQVHRYLDLGASLEVCKGPVDVLAADAVRELLAVKPGRPTILAESGAVEPSHSGPFKLYDADKAGMLLHDVLFAPFFAGAAGPGHIWHWDRYVSPNDLWRHFDRFAEAVKDLDPPAEQFEPAMLEHPRLRVYALAGKRTTLVWCRDSRNDWMTELRDGRPPEIIEGAAIALGDNLPSLEGATVRAYDPWSNRWTNLKIEGRKIVLPAFSRSIVLRIDPTRK